MCRKKSDQAFNETEILRTISGRPLNRAPEVSGPRGRDLIGGIRLFQLRT